MICQPLPLTRVSTPQLIAAPVHEFSTFLTILKQAQGISSVILGEEGKTVVLLDMGMYKPAQKLLMAKKPELSNIVLRPGELHIRCVMRKPSFAYAKTKTQISFTVTAKLISAIVFATYIGRSLFFLNPKFHASSHRLYLYSLVCVGPGRKSECWFSHDAAHICIAMLRTTGRYIDNSGIDTAWFIWSDNY